MFAALPLLALPVIGYNCLVLMFLPGGRRGAATPRLNEAVMVLPAASGGRWPVTLGDLIVFVSLIILFIELLKSTGSRRAVIINHSLSLLLFAGCLVEFLLFQAFATSAFFLLATMVLLDVLAGFAVSLRREIDIG